MHPTRRGPIRWLILCGGVLVSAITLVTIGMIGDFRERALQNSERELSNTALLLARHFDREFEDFSQLQEQIVAKVGLALTLSREQFRSRMGTLDMHEALRARVGAGVGIAAPTMSIYDSDGILINSSIKWPVPDLTITDRPYFQALKENTAAAPVITEILHGRLSGSWTVLMARRLEGPGGEFLGVSTKGIPTVNLEQFFASVMLGEDSAISMHRTDGILLARHPHAEALIGRNLNFGPPEQRRIFSADNQTSRLVSPIDGRERVVASRVLTNLPIMMVATTTSSAALADWRKQTKLLVATAIVAVLTISVILFLIVRRLMLLNVESRRQLSLDKQRLNTAINNMTQGLLMFDTAGRIVVRNQRYIEMYGLTDNDALPGCNFREAIEERKLAGSFTGDVNEYCTTVLLNIACRNIVVMPTGDGRSIQIVNEPVPGGGWVETHEDITERKRAEERIAHMAHYDALTGLPNRLLFREHLERRFAQHGERAHFALLYIDIDEFKSINDSLGHPVGDELLKGVADRLRRCMQDGDFVARLGGDEFAIVQDAPQSDADISGLVAQIYREIRQPLHCLGHQISTDASIGIATAPADGIDIDQLIKNADLAMYSAKSDGRRTHRFFEPSMDAIVKARRSLELDLRQAIVNRGFEIYYQPVVDLGSGAITGCEALLRWRHPTRGMISPAEFIPVAEDTGLINELGEWVLATACAEAESWPDDIILAVNVSPVQFKGEAFALKVAAALGASNLPPHRLELEITEAVLIRDDEVALAVLHQLRGVGVRIALDDFGTGYSSLSYLQRFPFDKIKIDRSFVDDLGTQEASAAIVQAVVNIAAARTMTTTAEGVETAMQRDLLRTLGCTQMQGYLFSPAIPAKELRQLFAAQSAGTASAVA